MLRSRFNGNVFRVTMFRTGPQNQSAAQWSVIAFLVAAALFSPPSFAHPESFSNVRLTLAHSTMHVTLILPVRDLGKWFPAGRYKNYTADVVQELGAQADDLLVVAWDEQPARATRTNVHPGQMGYIIVEEDFGIPAGAGSLQMRSSLLANLPNDHQQLAMVEDARRGPSAERILAEETLTAQQDTLSINLPEAPSESSASTLLASNTKVAGARDIHSRRVTGRNFRIIFIGCLIFITALAFIMSRYRRIVMGFRQGQRSM
jgi:hypothetical protein